LSKNMITSCNIIIHQVFNSPVSSNCYVLHLPESRECLIIDPGTEDNKPLKEYLDHHQLAPTHIILTHHHFDHVWGVNDLIACYHPKVISSKACSERIVDTKLNLSAYYSEKDFILKPSDIHVEDIQHTFIWLGHVFFFISTKGHSESCISILVGNCLFTGDALIKDTKTVTKLPGGNKAALKVTFLKYQELLLKNKHLTVYPGHGEIFDLNAFGVKQNLPEDPHHND